MDQRKIDTFKVCLQSVYAEQQTFGAVGIQRLREKGIKVPKKLRQLARYIRRRNIEIFTCHGHCMYRVKPFFRRLVKKKMTINGKRVTVYYYKN